MRSQCLAWYGHLSYCMGSAALHTLQNVGMLESSRPKAHQEIFTSGAYVAMFESEVNSNFARVYSSKLNAVIAAVAGQDLRVLDIGGGMGRMSIPLSMKHYVTLTDVSPQMLEKARPWAGERLELKVADACELPFPDRSFDVVLCIDVIPHLPGPPAMAKSLSEARRVLKPGGMLLVDSTNAMPAWTLAYPSYLGLRPLHPRRVVRILLGRGVDPAWQSRVHHYRKKVFVDAVAAAGLRITKLMSFGPAVCPKWHLAIAEL